MSSMLRTDGFIREDLSDKTLFVLDGGVEEGVERSLGDVLEVLHALEKVSRGA